MKHFLLAGAAVAAALATALPSEAYVIIVGRGPAADCYEAAASDRRDRVSIERCDLALAEDFLTLDDRAATLVNRAILYLRRGGAGQALSDLDAAIALKPDLTEAYVMRGAALVALNRHQDAVDQLTRALAMAPANPERAHFYRAAAHEELGDLRAAYTDYRRAAELAPDWRAPQLELARFQVRAQ